MKHTPLLFIGIMLFYSPLYAVRYIGTHLGINRLKRENPKFRNYQNPLISDTLKLNVSHIDQDFLEKTDILEVLTHLLILSPKSFKKVIELCAFGYYMPKDYDSLENNSVWREKAKKTTNQLLTAIFLLAPPK